MNRSTNDGADLREALFEYTDHHVTDPVLVLDERRCLLGANQAAIERSMLGVVELLHSPPLSTLWSDLDARGQASAEIPSPNAPERRLALFAFAVTRGYVIHVRQPEIEVNARSLANKRRIEALGLLTAGVVHDLNNLLAPIQLIAEALARDPSARTRAAAEEIRSAAVRATELTRSTLAVARGGDRRPDRISVGAVVSNVRALIEHVVGPNIAVRVEVANDAPQATMDRARLEHALLNLAANARDAMPDGGTLTLSVSRIVAGDGSHSGAAPEYVALTVADTGLGMTSRVHMHVFEPFHTTKHEIGSGLGLATVRAFVADSGGLISVSSRPRSGTAVALFFPSAGRQERPTLPDIPKPNGTA